MAFQLFEALAQSKFRARFKLDFNDRAYITRVGLARIKAHVYDFIQKRLAPRDLANDGKQTPFKGHPAFKAQHATATCCRGCLKKWYHIEKNRGLSVEEINMVVNTIMTWIGKELDG